MRTTVAFVSIALLACLPAGVAGAKEELAAEAPSRPVTAKERDAAIAKGVTYLDRTVFRVHDASGTPRKQFTVAVTGLVGLLVGDGQTTTARRRAGIVDKTRTYLRAYVAEVREGTSDPARLAETSDQTSSEHVMQYTWPIAMAGLFFGEMHARGLERTESAETLRTIVDVLEAAQAPNGGWGHAQVRGRGKAPRNQPDGRVRRHTPTRFWHPRIWWPRVWRSYDRSRRLQRRTSSIARSPTTSTPSSRTGTSPTIRASVPRTWT